MIGPFHLDRCAFGDALELGRQLPDESIHCIVTSPPYWGLRDYGVEGQLGLEKTPEEYVDRLVEILREHRRALRADGTLWLNLGDCYATGAGSYRNPGSDVDPVEHGGKQSYTRDYALAQPNRMPGLKCFGPSFRRDRRPREDDPHRKVPFLKSKDLVGIPWRVAFSLQADGWYLRSDIIWNKPNPMPESIQDRPTNSHEYIFLLTKSGDPIFWIHRDGRAVSILPDPDYRWIHRETDEEVDEEPAGDWKEKWKRTNLWRGHDYFYDIDAIKEVAQDWGLRDRTRWKSRDPDHNTDKPHTGGEDINFAGRGRNKRTVWTVPTHPYPEAHFATFPPDLIKPCIMAGTSERGCCPDCGAPFVRRTIKTKMKIRRSSRAEQMGRYGRTQSSGTMLSPAESRTTGWQPYCNCGKEKPIPPVVLDPFLGSGTTGEVCQDLGRHWIGFELNESYEPLIEKRTRQMGLFGGAALE